MHYTESVLEDHPDAITGPECTNVHSFGYPVACPDYCCVSCSRSQGFFQVQFKLLVIMFKPYMAQSQINCRTISSLGCLPFPADLVGWVYFLFSPLKCCYLVGLKRCAFSILVPVLWKASWLRLRRSPS